MKIVKCILIIWQHLLDSTLFILLYKILLWIVLSFFKMRLNKNMTCKGFAMGTLEYEAMSNPNLLWAFPGKFGLSDWDYFLLIIQSRRHLSSGFMFNRREELGFVNLTLEELVFVNLTVQHLKEKKNIGCRAGVCRLRTVQVLDDLRSSSEPWKHQKFSSVFL